MNLAFHACPPPGEWLNDPNGLVHADGQWRLFVQHRADPPAFRATGWARLSSPDLLNWTWDGPVIPVDGDDWAYSGSVTHTGDDLIAVHTVHDATTGLERQMQRVSSDAGASWSAAIPMVGAATNSRDPFIFNAGTTMLLAQPCDWDNADTASSIAILQHFGDGWRETGRIGPWHAPGVLWEVPVLVRVEGRDVLIVSTIDRRHGGADCAVFAWIGIFGASGFELDPGIDANGQRLDLGPDFYAAMTSGTTPVIVGWLSSWATARAIPWPGFAGGPISLPRRLTLAGSRVRQHINPPITNAFCQPVATTPVAGQGGAKIDGTANFELTITGHCAGASFIGDPTAGTLLVERWGAHPLSWRRCHPDIMAPCNRRTLALFIDGPVVELFIEPCGAAVSLALPADEQPFLTSLTVADAVQPISWRV